MFFRRKKATRTTAPTAAKPALESLEDRSLLSVSVNHGVLTLLGSSRADRFIVSLNAPAADKIVVSDNGRVKAFDRARITSISADGRAGNDLIELDQSNGQIPLPTTLLGGAGDDTVLGGGGNDCIDGGAGDDVLYGQGGGDKLLGGPGDDYLDGGTGNDALNGGAGDDKLIGGNGSNLIVGGLDADVFEAADIARGQVQDLGVGSDATEIAAADAPQGVQDALANLVGGGSVELLLRKFSGDTITYLTDFHADGLDKNAVLAETGAVLELDTDIDPASLPPEVYDAVFRQLPTGNINSASFVTSVSGDRFDVNVSQGDQVHELKISLDGVILEDQAGPVKPADPAQKFRDFSNTRPAAFAHLEPGTSMTLEGIIEGGKTEQLIINVLDAVKMIDGVVTRVLEERAVVDGQLVEVAKNYVVSDKLTKSLYYFGEDVDIYENGQIVAHTSTWRSGEKGAKFGVLIPGLPILGQSFAEERAPGVALDTGQIVSTNETVVTPFGTFTGVVKVRETTPLEPGAEDFKYYAPGIGLVQSNTLKLVSFTLPPN